MPIRLFMYMAEIWRDELRNTDKNIKKRKDFKIPAIVPIIVYNGKNNWTAARSFKEVLSGHEIFEDNIIDFKYMLYDINRMDTDELLNMSSVISSVFSLDQADMDDEEIIRRLKIIGRVIKRKSSIEQIKLFNNWIVGILKSRYADKVGDEIIDIINKSSNKEGMDMVSNLGKNLEQSINKKVNKAKEEGEKKKALEIAKELLDILDVETIATKTGLTIDEVKRLKH